MRAEASSAQRCVMRLHVVFAQVLLVLERPLAQQTRHGLAWHVHVADVLPQVPGIAEHLVTQVTALRLHTPPLAPACGHQSPTER